MKIIADHKISSLDSLFCSKGELVALSAETITRKKLHDADCLFVRSVTTVNALLLEGTSIQFIGTATAGTDHLDLAYLNQANIAWTHAPGANAQAVSDYVLCVIASLRQQGLLKKNALRAGVVGVGQAGQRVVALLFALGFEVLMNDPPRAKREADFISIPLEEFMDLDLICLHTPLTFDGEFPSYHLINKDFLSRQKSGGVLLNAGRGAVVDSVALKQASHMIKVLDVWENEPDIDLELLQSASIATPHIAGYSRASKHRATNMLYDAFCKHFKISTHDLGKLNKIYEKPLKITLTDPQWGKTVLQTEDLLALSDAFKQRLLNNPNDIANQFEQARKDYLLRPEFTIYS